MATDNSEQATVEPLIFEVHSDSSIGAPKPPYIRTSDHPHSVFGFFENEYREWLIFEYDTLERKGRIFHQDTGARPFPIVDGQVTEDFLTPMEKAWVAVSWRAATMYLAPVEVGHP